jgi:archaellin
MLRVNKRAIMGIGTLIIFIATILVAAVAAGVLISTSGILQQRALITGQEARKKITNSVEIISIVAYGNKTDESLNNFEVLVRLDAGSDPIQMKGFDISWIGPDHDAAANLQHPSLNDPNVDETGFNDAVDAIDNLTWTYIRDLDNDNVMERVMLAKYWYNSTDFDPIDYLLFNMSGDTTQYYYYNLSEDLDNVSMANPAELIIRDGPIVGRDGYYYGFFTLIANVTENNSIPNSVNNTFNITANPVGPCLFETLAPEFKYCYEVMHGDDDLVLADGEVFKLKFKLRDSERMFIGQEFRFIFSSEKGRLSQAQARTPDVITTLRIPLWPVG